jgi:hypothetical protein
LIPLCALCTTSSCALQPESLHDLRPRADPEDSKQFEVLLKKLQKLEEGLEPKKKKARHSAPPRHRTPPPSLPDLAEQPVQVPPVFATTSPSVAPPLFSMSGPSAPFSLSAPPLSLPMLGAASFPTLSTPYAFSSSAPALGSHDAHSHARLRELEQLNVHLQSRVQELEEEAAMMRGQLLAFQQQQQQQQAMQMLQYQQQVLQQQQQQQPHSAASATPLGPSTVTQSRKRKRR